MFTEKDLQTAIEQGIFSKDNDVLVPPATVIRFFEKWAAEKCRDIRHKSAEIAIDPDKNTDEKHRDIMNLKA